MINLANLSALYNEPKLINGLPGPEIGLPPPRISTDAIRKIIKGVGYVFLAPLFLTGCPGSQVMNTEITMKRTIQNLKSRDPQVRRTAIMHLNLLSRHDPNAKEAVPYLIQALKDDEQVARVQAAQALGNIGSNAVEAVPALTEGLKDAELKIWAAEALSKIDPKVISAIPVLIDVLKKSNLDSRILRHDIVEALGRFGPSAKDAVPILIGILGDDNEVTRNAAAKALKKIRGR